MFDYRGYVAEATGANVFFVQDGVLHTPTPDCFSRPDRQSVIAIAKARGIKVVERHIMPDEMTGFTECFLTGSAAEVTPVSEIGPYTFKPGALTETFDERLCPTKFAAWPPFRLNPSNSPTRSARHRQATARCPALRAAWSSA